MKRTMFVFVLFLLALPLAAAECGDGNCTGNETFEVCPADCDVVVGAGCQNDSLVCQDGSSVGRDPLNNCSFYNCPEIACIDLCGDGVCQYDVECQGQSGCACLETLENCSADCSDQVARIEVNEVSGGFFSGGTFWIVLSVIGALLFVYIGLKILKWLFWSLAIIMVVLAVLFWLVL